MKPTDIDDVNEEVNRLPYKSDPERYGEEDFWERVDKTGGDCEDFALAKLNRLALRGWPIRSMRLAAVTTEDGGPHSVLLIRTDEGDRVLDNRQPRPVALEDLRRIGYRPVGVQEKGGSKVWRQWLWEEDK